MPIKNKCININDDTDGCQQNHAVTLHVGVDTTKRSLFVWSGWGIQTVDVRQKNS